MGQRRSGGREGGGEVGATEKAGMGQDVLKNGLVERVPGCPAELKEAGCGQNVRGFGYVLPKQVVLFVLVVRDGGGLEEGEQDQICTWGGSLCEVLKMPGGSWG